MRTLGLVLALLVVGCTTCVGDSVTVDLYDNGTLYMTCPLVPFNPDPLSVFTGPGGPIAIDYNLNRWDAPSQGWVVYDSIDPSGFGNCLLGDGYQLNNVDNVDYMTYSGVPDGVPDSGGNMTDMWISLPGNQLDVPSAGGMHLWGQPFNHDTPTNGTGGTGDNIHFTDGTTLKTWDEAALAGWVDSIMSYWNPVADGWDSLDYTGLGNDDTLRAGKCYILYTRKDNLALIIPAT